MPELGRFTSVDPLAEIMPGINPYHFGFNNPILFNDPTGMMPNAITSTFIDPNGKIIDVRDDGDRNIYLVHDPDNWDGTKDGLATVGHTPEPATLKDYVGKNLYTEEVAGFMFDEAQRLDIEASIYVDAFQLGAVAESFKRRDQMLQLLKTMRNLKKKQLLVLLELMLIEEGLLNDVEHSQAIGMHANKRILLRTGLSLYGNTLVDWDDQLVNQIFPESGYDAIDAEYDAKEKALNEKYEKLIEEAKNR